MVFNISLRNERIHDGTKDDQREPAQRDRDRVIHSSALRRLAGVTQVVDPAEGHVFHNRLTHTLKVAQIGRRLAEKFVKEYSEDDLSEIGHIDPEVVETAALLHDLGHPPFGHLAEKILDNKVCENGNTQEGYEGNAQSFRIATQLEIRQPDINGLNLSRASLNALLKYPWHRGESGKTQRKWGAYRVDRRFFNWVREPFGDSQLRTVEAEIMDWSDDIAFSVHDLGDFYRAGLIPLDRLATDKEARDSCLEKIFQRWDDEPRPPDELETPKEPFEEAFHKILELLPIDRPFDGTNRQKGNLNRASSELIDRYVQRTALNPDPNMFGKHLDIAENLRYEVKALKQLIWIYVIDSPALATQQFGKAKIIDELFEIIFEEVMPEKKSKWCHILPNSFLQDYLRILDIVEGRALREYRARLTADYISSMTDNEAIATHRRLTGANPGTLLDLRFT